jgi:hypothetical protein
MKHYRRRLPLYAALTACLLAVTTAMGQEDVPSFSGAAASSALSLDQLTRMSWPELEQMYLAADAGSTPEGYLEGKAIYDPCARFSGVRSKVTGALWRGKIFDCAGCTLINQWCGIKAIRANVYQGPSWLDGKTSLVLDYSDTSLVWADVRDEVREVAPGLYLGRMYRRKAMGPEFQYFFALHKAER